MLDKDIAHCNLDASTNNKQAAIYYLLTSNCNLLFTN